MTWLLWRVFLTSNKHFVLFVYVSDNAIKQTETYPACMYSMLEFIIFLRCCHCVNCCHSLVQSAGVVCYHDPTMFILNEISSCISIQQFKWLSWSQDGGKSQNLNHHKLAMRSSHLSLQSYLRLFTCYVYFSGGKCNVLVHSYGVKQRVGDFGCDQG